MKFLSTTVAVFYFLIVLTATSAHAQELDATASAAPYDEYIEGKIKTVTNTYPTDPLGDEYLVQELTLDITKGPEVGKELFLINDTISIINGIEYRVGDEVMVLHSVGYEGGETYYITDYVRRAGLMRLFVAFAILAIGIGGIWGVRSLIGMAFSFAVIFKFILPQILAGQHAVLTAIVGAAFIIPVTFSLSHGWNKKTLVASLSTIVTLAITGLLAHIFVDAVHLTGYGSEEAAFLQYQLGQTINIKGLLLAGIIIAALGILDDITISQVSVVNELARANKKLDSLDLFKRAMNVGRDHIASLINTLVLAYTGAALPLLLLFINNPSPISEILNLELIAEEIVRTLVGSMGLILAVPITTFVAARWLKLDHTIK